VLLYSFCTAFCTALLNANRSVVFMAFTRWLLEAQFTVAPSQHSWYLLPEATVPPTSRKRYRRVI
jgi:hypothetical protein